MQDKTIFLGLGGLIVVLLIVAIFNDIGSDDVVAEQSAVSESTEIQQTDAAAPAEGDDTDTDATEMADAAGADTESTAEATDAQAESAEATEEAEADSNEMTESTAESETSEAEAGSSSEDVAEATDSTGGEATDAAAESGTADADTEETAQAPEADTDEATNDADSQPESTESAEESAEAAAADSGSATEDTTETAEADSGAESADAAETVEETEAGASETEMAQTTEADAEGESTAESAAAAPESDSADTDTSAETAGTETDDASGTGAETEDTADVATLQARIAELEEQLAERAEEASSDESAEATESAEANAPEAAGDAQLRGIGQTAIFDDGALRVFVSRLDPDAGEARLAINGENAIVAVGEAARVQSGETDCSVILRGVSAEGAEIEALCGGDIPQPEGLRVGETELFEDGQLRVFVSMIQEDAARLVVNGERTMLNAGDSVLADLENARCRVLLDGIDGGAATVTATCGPLPARSEPASAGTSILLGEGDGLVRVFVSYADGSENVARFAVNGLDVMTGSTGDSVALPSDCELVVEAIEGNTATFSLECPS